MNKSAPPTAALPIADCPNKECKWDAMHCLHDEFLGWSVCCWVPNETIGVGGSLGCGYSGPCAETKEEAIRKHNLLCAPAVQATADADLIDALRSIPTCGNRGDLVWFSDIEKILSRHSAVSPKAAANGPRDIKRLVDRFLGWKLPENFNPDAGISFKKTFNDHFPVPTKHEPTGTNLFDASQAEAMLRYVLETPAAVSGDKQEKERG